MVSSESVSNASFSDAPSQQLLHISVCSDAGMLCHLPSFFWSLAKHHAPGSIHIHFGNAETKDPTGFKKAIIEAADHYRLALTWYELVDDLNEHIGLIQQPDRILPLPPATYGRWFLAERIDSTRVSRLLYLDVDTLITGSLLPLMEMDMAGEPIAAAINFAHSIADNSYYMIRHQEEELKRLKLPKKSPMLNAGILVIDLVQWHALQITSALLRERQSMLDQDIKLLHEDQDVLNHWGNQRIARMDARFNVMSLPVQVYCPSAETLRLWHYIRLIHYAGVKPWQNESWIDLPAQLASIYMEAVSPPSKKEHERAEAGVMHQVLNDLLHHCSPDIACKSTPLLRLALKDYRTIHTEYNNLFDWLRHAYAIPHHFNTDQIISVALIKQGNLRLIARYSRLRAFRKSLRRIRRSLLPYQIRMKLVLALFWQCATQPKSII